MGTWGVDVFENDAAADLLGDVDDASVGDRAGVLRERLVRVAEAVGEYLEGPDADEAFTAAVILAIAGGALDAGEFTGADDHLGASAQSLGSPDATTVSLALRALARIAEPEQNEWLALWEEAGELADALGRLGSVRAALEAVEPGAGPGWAASPGSRPPMEKSPNHPNAKASLVAQLTWVRAVPVLGT